VRALISLSVLGLQLRATNTKSETACLSHHHS
jgi:hypothetical protein